MRVEAGVERTLRERHVACLPDEAPELASRDRMLIDPESVYPYAMDRTLLRIEALGAHHERSGGDTAHHWSRCVGG